jgi:hypothetical protein
MLELQLIPLEFAGGEAGDSLLEVEQCGVGLRAYRW